MKMKRERSHSPVFDMMFAISWLFVVVWQFHSGNPEYASWEMPMLMTGIGIAIHGYQGWWRYQDRERGKWYWRFAYTEIAFLILGMAMGMQVWVNA